MLDDGRLGIWAVAWVFVNRMDRISRMKMVRMSRCWEYCTGGIHFTLTPMPVPGFSEFPGTFGFKRQIPVMSPKFLRYSLNMLKLRSYKSKMDTPLYRMYMTVHEQLDDLHYNATS